MSVVTDSILVAVADYNAQQDPDDSDLAILTARVLDALSEAVPGIGALLVFGDGRLTREPVSVMELFEALSLENVDTVTGSGYGDGVPEPQGDDDDGNEYASPIHDGDETDPDPE